MDMFFYHLMLWRLAKHVPSSMAGGAGYTNRLRAGGGGPTPPQRLAVAPLVAAGAAAGSFTRRLPEPSEFLIRALRQWRVQLPRHISLRIALPAQRVLQQRMARPDVRLREPERSDYISGHGLKQFPLDGQTLALDYRAAPADKAALLLTRAAAGAAAVAALFTSGGPVPASGRYHPLRAAGDGDGGGRCSPRADASSRPRMAVGGAGRRRVRLWSGSRRRWCAGAAGTSPDAGRRRSAVYAGSVLAGDLPAGCLAWSPLSAFTQLRPPLPVHPSAFALAGGLALREEDR